MAHPDKLPSPGDLKPKTSKVEDEVQSPPKKEYKTVPVGMAELSSYLTEVMQRVIRESGSLPAYWSRIEVDGKNFLSTGFSTILSHFSQLRNPRYPFDPTQGDVWGIDPNSVTQLLREQVGVLQQITGLVIRIKNDWEHKDWISDVQISTVEFDNLAKENEEKHYKELLAKISKDLQDRPRPQMGEKIAIVLDFGDVLNKHKDRLRQEMAEHNWSIVEISDHEYGYREYKTVVTVTPLS